MQQPVPYFKNDPVVVFILSFITCGLYLIYWNIKMARVLNALMNRELISEPIAIISGCCWPANLYYFYLAGSALPEIGQRSGRVGLEDKSTLLVVLGLFFPIISAVILQSEINRIYDQPRPY